MLSASSCFLVCTDNTKLWWVFVIIIYFGHLEFEVSLVYLAGEVLDLSQW